MPIPSSRLSSSSGSLFFRSSTILKGRDSGIGFKKKGRPPPLDTVAINSSWNSPSDSEDGGSMVVGLADFLREGPREGEAGRERRTPSSMDQLRLDSAGLLGSFSPAESGQWGDTVRRSLLNASSSPSDTPSSPSTPRARSPLDTHNKPIPPTPTSRFSLSSPTSPPPQASPFLSNPSTSSSASSTFTPATTASPTDTTTLTPSSSLSSSPFTPPSSLSSYSSLSSFGSPQTPPTLETQLRPIRSNDSSETGCEQDQKPKDIFSKLWRKGTESMATRGKRSGGGVGGHREEDVVADLRSRRSKSSLVTARGSSKVLGPGGGGWIEEGPSLRRRLSKNFRSHHSTPLDLGPSSLQFSESHLRDPPPSSASPITPSETSVLAIPRPPPFFYGGSADDDDASSSTLTPKLIPRELGGSLRIGATFVRSTSTSSTDSGVSEDSFEEAEIGFGERGRWEWAGFQSPVATTFEAKSVRADDRSPTDTTSPPFTLSTLSSHHRPTPSLEAGKAQPTSSSFDLQRSRSRSSSLSRNFTVRDSPSSSPSNGQPPRFPTTSLLDTPPTSSNSCVFASPPLSTPHGLNLSASSKISQTRDSLRCSRYTSPRQTQALDIRIIHATPSKSLYSSKDHRSVSLPDPNDPTRLSPSRTDAGGSDEDERAWSAAKAQFAQSLNRQTSDHQRLRTLTSTSLHSNSSSPSSSPASLSPHLLGTSSFFFLDTRRRNDTPSLISLTQNILPRYYEPSVRTRQASGSTIGSDDSSEGSTTLEALMAQLDESWDEEEEEEDALAVEEAVGWKWPVPPKSREVREEGTEEGREIAGDGLQFFPLDHPLDHPTPSRDVYVYVDYPSGSPSPLLASLLFLDLNESTLKQRRSD